MYQLFDDENEQEKQTIRNHNLQQKNKITNRIIKDIELFIIITGSVASGLAIFKYLI